MRFVAPGRASWYADAGAHGVALVHDSMGPCYQMRAGATGSRGAHAYDAPGRQDWSQVPSGARADRQHRGLPSPSHELTHVNTHTPCAPYAPCLHAPRAPGLLSRIHARGSSLASSHLFLCLYVSLSSCLSVWVPGCLGVSGCVNVCLGVSTFVWRCQRVSGCLTPTRALGLCAGLCLS